MSFWKNRPLLIAVILIIILFVLLFATAGTSGEGGTQSVIGGIFAPMQEGLYNFTASIGDFFSNLFSTTDLDQGKSGAQAEGGGAGKQAPGL